MQVSINDISRRRVYLSALFVLQVVILGYVMPRWADPNQNSRLNMVVAVVEDHTFRIDEYVHNTVDYARVGEHYFSDKAPGVAFLGMPFYLGLRVVFDTPLVVYLSEQLAHSSAFERTLNTEGSGVLVEKVRFALAQVVLAFVLGVIPTALLGVLIYLVVARWTNKESIRLIGVFGYCLLTPVFAYANTLYGHQLSAALLFAAFYLVMSRQIRLARWRLLVVGLLLGYSVVTEYPTILMVGVLFGYTAYYLHREGAIWRIGWVVLTGALVAVGWMSYNTAIFGGPLNLGYSYSELWVEQHHTGFMSLTWPRGDALWGITFSRFRGLFLLAPWLLLALPGWVLWWRCKQYRPEWVASVACTVGMILFNGSSGMWWGGFAVGPRYLLPALPFLVLATTFAFERWNGQRWFWSVCWTLLAWSFVATWGLSLAGQAFPSDALANPLVEYALPNWRSGNVARNFGTLLGLPGLWSMVPLLVLMFGNGVIVARRWRQLDVDTHDGVPVASAQW